MTDKQPPAAQPVAWETKPSCWPDKIIVKVNGEWFTVPKEMLALATPDSRIAELEGLLREVVAHWSDIAGNAITYQELIDRIAAALKEGA